MHSAAFLQCELFFSILLFIFFYNYIRPPYFFCFNFCFLLCKEYQCPPPHSIIIHKFFKSVRCTVTISYFFLSCFFLCKLVNCVLKKKNAFSCVQKAFKKKKLHSLPTLSYPPSVKLQRLLKQHVFEAFLDYCNNIILCLCQSCK